MEAPSPRRAEVVIGLGLLSLLIMREIREVEAVLLISRKEAGDHFLQACVMTIVRARRGTAIDGSLLSTTYRKIALYHVPFVFYPPCPTEIQGATTLCMRIIIGTHSMPLVTGKKVRHVFNISCVS